MKTVRQKPIDKCEMPPKNLSKTGKLDGEDKENHVGVILFLLGLFCLGALPCIPVLWINSCDNREALARRERSNAFNLQIRKVEDGLGGLEGRIEVVSGLSDSDRTAIIQSVRQLREDYGKVLELFQGIRSDVLSEGITSGYQLGRTDTVPCPHR